jgi:outer membrane cobalamin receptor
VERKRSSWRFSAPVRLLGDGVLVRANPDLVSEQRDNASAGFEGKTGIGENSRVSGGSVFFVRSTQNQILLQGLGAAVQYQNLLTARSTGVEVYGHAALFDGLILVDGNFTYQSLRNTSTDGKFAQYQDALCT